MLDVPRLKLSTPVIQGDDTAILKRAVGHLPDTPMPWEDGNSAVAGHRDGLFRPLKDVKVGDEIRFRTTRDQFRYRVTNTAIVLPNDVSVLKRQDGSTLTLITCYPFYYVGAAPQRFVIHAVRVPPATPSAGTRHPASGTSASE
jgi:sortase A